MLFVVQNVDECIVKDENNTLVDKIQKGYIIYFGLEKEDIEQYKGLDENKINFFAKKSHDFIKENIEERKEIMLLSQFTLMARFKKNKPDFHHASNPEIAKDVFYMLKDLLRANSGIFRTTLQIETKGQNINTRFLKL
ncbi:DTD1 [Ecytonucleospora hepatopenaei]|uniref:D-aminoacyl-tRNA deacylase n=1 Tax=Ecytonucleospora hepatopenaei TaxID=646526 RepID=A0A1W0E7Y9_9MICR|nr:DTD1 [Ecytonucleospora hepatopenaei]